MNMESSSQSTIFHQRQKWLRCGLHAVNNVVQDDVASPQQFQEIAASHAAIAGKGPILFRLGLGDYDGNTVIEFLQSRAFCQVEFIDRRCAAKAIHEQLSATEGLKGFLLNVKGRNAWIPSFIYSCRHWYAVVRVNSDDWFVIDSSKKDVEKVDNIQSFLQSIQEDECLEANLMAVRGGSTSSS